MTTLKQKLEEYKERVSTLGGGREALGVFEAVIDQAFLAGAEAGWMQAMKCVQRLTGFSDETVGSMFEDYKDGGESE